mgnify:CR=1 FL=1
MIRRPPRSTQSRSSAASDVYKRQALNKAIHSEKDIAFSELKQFIERLETPRNIILLVPAGKIVDFVLQDLKTYWGENDVIVDCGNSHFTDTQRRLDELANSKVHFMGMGISGGEAGARYGASTVSYTHLTLPTIYSV